MPFNALGPDEAIDVLRREIEEERAEDPSFPLRFTMHWEEGPVLDCNEPGDISRTQHRLLLRLSKRHPEIAIVTSLVDRDIITDEMLSVDLVRYSNGQRRTVGSFRSQEPDRWGQRVRLLAALLRYDQDRTLERR